MIHRQLFDFTKGDAINQLRNGKFRWDVVFSDSVFPVHSQKEEKILDRIKQSFTSTTNCLFGRFRQRNQNIASSSTKHRYINREFLVITNDLCF
jgi:hypothetical protein